ncbi:MAG: prolipoprotein diacylglyceryl transferase [Clostridia bacterium]|nr:prolipoprotein diacylglyceryl transferase [Clostridia bacterium]
MYPYDLFLGLDLYDLSIAVGFLGALLYFRIFADRKKFGVALQNLVIVGALSAIVGGYCSAVLFQAFYNYLEDGVFVIANNTGATFYGGLIGGAAVFLAVYFGVGYLILKKNRETPASRFWELTEIAAGSIALAHGFGRLGCLFAGCCHGKVTDAWYGIYNAYLDAKTVPIQLFEAIFLFALAAYMTYRLLKGKHGNLALYLSGYAVWRFIVEFLRTDERGQSIVPFLTPSQFIAVCLFIVGVALWLIEGYLLRRKTKKGDETDDPA